MLHTCPFCTTFFFIPCFCPPTRRHMEFLGQGSDLGHSHNLSCSCGNGGSLTHCAGLGSEPVSQRSQNTLHAVAPQPERAVFFLKKSPCHSWARWGVDLKVKSQPPFPVSSLECKIRHRPIVSQILGTLVRWGKIFPFPLVFLFNSHLYNIFFFFNNICILAEYPFNRTLGFSCFCFYVLVVPHGEKHHTKQSKPKFLCMLVRCTLLVKAKINFVCALIGDRERNVAREGPEVEL